MSDTNKQINDSNPKPKNTAAKLIESKTASYGTEFAAKIGSHTLFSTGLKVTSIILHPVVMLAEVLCAYQASEIQKYKNIEKEIQKVEEQLGNNEIDFDNIEQIKLTMQDNKDCEKASNLNFQVAMNAFSAVACVGLAITILTGTSLMIGLGIASISAIAFTSIANSALNFCTSLGLSLYHTYHADHEKAQEHAYAALEHLLATTVTIAIVAALSITPPGQTVLAGMLLSASLLCTSYIGYELVNTSQQASNLKVSVNERIQNIDEQVKIICATPGNEYDLTAPRLAITHPEEYEKEDNEDESILAEDDKQLSKDVTTEEKEEEEEKNEEDQASHKEQKLGDTDNNLDPDE